MKKKPDLSGFQLPVFDKDPSAFLDGAEADRREETAPPGSNKKRQVVQKLFYLPVDVAAELKIRAALDSGQRGRRVTESELVESALRAYLRRRKQ